MLLESTLTSSFLINTEKKHLTNGILYLKKIMIFSVENYTLAVFFNSTKMTKWTNLTKPTKLYYWLN